MTEQQLLDAYTEEQKASAHDFDALLHLQRRASKWRALARARREQVRELKTHLKASDEHFQSFWNEQLANYCPGKPHCDGCEGCE